MHQIRHDGGGKWYAGQLTRWLWLLRRVWHSSSSSINLYVQRDLNFMGKWSLRWCVYTCSQLFVTVWVCFMLVEFVGPTSVMS